MPKQMLRDGWNGCGRPHQTGSRIIVPSVMAIALVTFGVCWLGGFANAEVALVRAVTVLVIACPGPLRWPHHWR